MSHDKLLTSYLKTSTAFDAFVAHSELGSVTGIIRWGYVRDNGLSGAEVYIDNRSPYVPDMTVLKTATGVYDVTVPGVSANGGWHGIFVSPQQGQTTVFRACKTFQTASVGNLADTVIVKVRCYDANAVLADTNPRSPAATDAMLPGRRDAGRAAGGAGSSVAIRPDR